MLVKCKLLLYLVTKLLQLSLRYLFLHPIIRFFFFYATLFGKLPKILDFVFKYFIIIKN